MSRATLLYIVSLVLCAGGLWLVLRTGSRLVAPTDLSGVWSVGGEDPAQPQVLGETVRIEQSGRYLRLSFEHGLVAEVKLVDERRPDAPGGDGLDLEYRGAAWSLTAHGTGADGPLIFRLEGPRTHAFTVTRRPGGADLLDDELIADASPPPPPAPPQPLPASPPAAPSASAAAAAIDAGADAP